MIDDVQWYVSLARETGKRVVGIDRSAGMLAVAVANEGKRETRGESWLEIRGAPPDNRIDLIHDGGVIPLWWMTRAEQEGLIDIAGLELEALYGGCHREPYDETRYEMVWVARKTA